MNTDVNPKIKPNSPVLSVWRTVRSHVQYLENTISQWKKIQTYPNQEACAYERNDGPQGVENCRNMRRQNRVKGVRIHRQNTRKGQVERRTGERSVATDDEHHSSEDAKDQSSKITAAQKKESYGQLGDTWLIVQRAKSNDRNRNNERGRRRTYHAANP